MRFPSVVLRSIAVSSIAFRSVLLRAGLALALVLGVVPLAFAHAVLVSSTPADGASAPAGPLALQLRYNSRIDAGRSRLSLDGPAGAGQVLKLDADPAAQDRLAAHIEAMPGQYVLHWQVLSVDGHVTRGEVKFTVTGQ